MAALAWASDLPVATALFWPQELAPKQQSILQIGALWSWWPALCGSGSGISDKDGDSSPRSWR
jgi:hypothetical protein